MNEHSDPEVGRAIRTLAVEPGSTFWQELDAMLEHEARSLASDVSTDSYEIDLSPVVDISTARRRRSRSYLMLGAVAAATLVVIGIVNNRDPKTSVETTEAASPTAIASPPAPVTDPTGGVSTAPATSGQLVVVTDPDTGSFAELRLNGLDGSVVSIPVEHARDVQGQPLPASVVSDGAQGLLYGLIDYDDNRSDRASRLLHLAAGASRPKVIAADTLEGIGSVLGVVETDAGPTVVYTTLLNTRTLSVPLGGGDPRFIIEGEAFGAGGTTIVTVNADDCRSFNILDSSGGVSPLINPRPPAVCAEGNGQVFELKLSPDGTRLAYIEGVGVLHVFDMSTGTETLVVDTGVGAHLSAFDGERVLVDYGIAGGIASLTVGPDGAIDNAAEAWQALDWPGYVIAPDAVLALE